MKLFRTYPYTGMEENEDDSSSIYYRLFTDHNLGFEIIENIFNGEISSVIYRKLGGFNFDLILKYHERNYCKLDVFQVEELISNNVFKLTCFTKIGKVFRFYIFHLNENQRVHKHQWYDNNFNLLEYHEEIYLGKNHIETKIFYPNSWNVSSNKLT